MGFPHPVRWVEIDGKAYVLGEEPAEVGLNRYGERVGDAAEDVYAATPGG
jgi:hypothetical protein